MAAVQASTHAEVQKACDIGHSLATFIFFTTPKFCLFKSYYQILKYACTCVHACIALNFFWCIKYTLDTPDPLSFSSSLPKFALSTSYYQIFKCVCTFIDVAHACMHNI